MNKNTREIIIGIGGIILIVILGIYFSPKLSILGRAIDAGKFAGNTVQGQLTKDNFNVFLQQQKVVQDLPKNAVISLRMYNFDSGERQWEKSYIINRGKADEGYTENPDMEIILSSKYIFEIAKDMCVGVKKARANGDIAFDVRLSTLSFLWKYKLMLGYRSCFGF